MCIERWMCPKNSHKQMGQFLKSLKVFKSTDIIAMSEKWTQYRVHFSTNSTCFMPVNKNQNLYPSYAKIASIHALQELVNNRMHWAKFPPKHDMFNLVIVMVINRHVCTGIFTRVVRDIFVKTCLEIWQFSITAISF